MLSKVLSGAIHGVCGFIVEVETDVSNGLPAFDIVGLPDSAVKESRERVRTAIKNSGYQFPVKRITINLAPADIKKEGPSFDLPIAIGILSCMNIIASAKLQNVFMAGELSLDGSVRPITGVLPMVYGAFSKGITTCFVPSANAEEAALIEGINVYSVNNINDIISHFNGKQLTPITVDIKEMFHSLKTKIFLDFADVRGQENVKRALEIAAAGGHNALMIGPPGSGKTMMAKRLPTILPDMSFEESIECTKIYSVAGLLTDKSSLISNRPFRSPHHTLSNSAMTGGGKFPKPGEISLSHNGVLFLDELPEFQKNALESLRQPLEDGQVLISRVTGSITYPSSFRLISSMNPCPCGYYGDRQKCSCSQSEVSRYLNRISGPLLDRIDIMTEAARVDYDDLHQGHVKAETSEQIKARVVAAHERQKKRYANEKAAITFNAQLSSSHIEKYCILNDECIDLLKQAFDVMGLSARAYHKILKLSRTIADVDDSDKIELLHLTEAIQYRSLDRKYWG